MFLVDIDKFEENFVLMAHMDGTISINESLRGIKVRKSNGIISAHYYPQGSDGKSIGHWVRIKVDCNDGFGSNFAVNTEYGFLDMNNNKNVMRFNNSKILNTVKAFVRFSYKTAEKMFNGELSYSDPEVNSLVDEFNSFSATKFEVLLREAEEAEKMYYNDLALKKGKR